MTPVVFSGNLFGFSGQKFPKFHACVDSNIGLQQKMPVKALSPGNRDTGTHPGIGDSITLAEYPFRAA